MEVAPAKSTRWRRALDPLGALLAVAYALPTLGYPFSRDHALFSYIGRVWLDGGLPYRDVYDFKPPGIYALNALATALLGRNEWGIRLVEVAGTLLAAWVIAWAIRRDRPRAVGEVGAIALLLVGLYYTTLNYWDTSQTEFWEALALLASYGVAERVQPVERAALASGALVGVAVAFKFPAPLVGIACTLIVAVRSAARASAWRERLARGIVAAALHGLGAALVVGAIGAYFAVRGGWNDMIDMLFRHLWDFHSHTKAAPGEARESFHLFWLHLFGTWLPIVGLAWASAVGLAARRRAWNVVRGALAALALFALSIGTVVLQGRYVLYQWGVVVPFACLCASYAVAELARLRPAAPLAVVAAVVLGDFAVAPGHPVAYRQMYRRAIAYERGDLDRWDYLEPFRGPFDYSYRVEERLGEIVRARARPGDQLVVRGYEPAVYTVSGLKSPSRFAVEIPLFLPGLTFKRAEWSAEHERSIWGARPRFFVTFASGTAEAALLESRGYHQIALVENMVAFERNDE